MSQGPWSEHLLCWMSWHQPGRWQLIAKQCRLFNEFCCLFLTRFFQHITLYQISGLFYSLLLNEKYLVQCTRMLEVLWNFVELEKNCVVNFIEIFKHISKFQHIGILLLNPCKSSSWIKGKSWCAFQQLFFFRQHSLFSWTTAKCLHIQCLFITLRWKLQTCSEKPRIALRLIALIARHRNCQMLSSCFFLMPEVANLSQLGLISFFLTLRNIKREQTMEATLASF